MFEPIIWCTYTTFIVINNNKVRVNIILSSKIHILYLVNKVEKLGSKLFFRQTRR